MPEAETEVRTSRASGRRVGIVGALVAALFFSASATSEAATFCVADPSCTPSGGGSNAATIQAAFDGAAVVPGKDTVEVGAGTFAPADSGQSNPIDLVGAGRTATQISAPGGQYSLLRLADLGSSVSALGVVMDGDDYQGLLIAGSASEIEVSGTSTSPNPVGVVLDSNSASLSHSRVLLPTAGPSTGVLAWGLAPVIEDSRVEAGTGIWGGETIRRVRVVAETAGITGFFSGGRTSLEQATIRILGAGGTALESHGGLFHSSLTATNVTALGPGSGTGATATAGCGMGPSTAMVTLRSTILRGFATDLSRVGTTCPPIPPLSPGGPSAATMDVAHSLFDPATITESGTGSLTLGPGNLNADPLFLDPAAGDLHLQSGSPAIDHGDPSPPAAGESTVDLDGNPREVDGDADATARRDIGAFERALPGTLTLTENGDGYGAVTSTPSGIVCGFDCVERFPEGTSVTLTATPEPGSSFTGFSNGPCPGSGNSCTVTIQGAAYVTATFVRGADPDDPPAAPPANSPPLDSTAPVLAFTAKRKQKTDRTVEVEASCDEACLLVGDGKVEVRPGRRAGNGAEGPAARRKQYELGKDAALLADGGNVTLELELSATAKRKAMKSLARGGKSEGDRRVDRARRRRQSGEHIRLRAAEGA